MGVDLFLHSVRMVLVDWKTSLRITGLLYLIYAVPDLLISLNSSSATAFSSQDQYMGLAGASSIAGMLAIVASLWIAVAWHRYVLLNEGVSRVLPPFHGRRMLTYFFLGFALAVVAGIPAIVIYFVVGFPMTMLGPMGEFIGFVPALAVGLVIFYRLSPLLPAAALGQPLPIGDAWQATKGATGTLVGLAIMSAIAGVIISLPGVALAFMGPIGQTLSLAWNFAIGWLVVVAGVSILTSIYGVYVEGRALPRRAY